jgi:hypothetical protein
MVKLEKTKDIAKKAFRISKTKLTPLQRQTIMQKYMDILMHASTCSNPQCAFGNCAKMKKLLDEHSNPANCNNNGNAYCTPDRTPDRTPDCTTDCIICNRVSNLLIYHASSCTNAECTVSRCSEIKAADIASEALASSFTDISL